VREQLDGVESGSGELERLAAAGVEVLNRPSALVAAHDKLLTARALRLAGLPHPHTWLIAEGMPAPAPELPIVLKPRFGSWGRDVELCRTADELRAALERVAFRGWFREHGALAQELVPPLGWDLRVVVAGGRVVGAVRRIAAEGEWRTNVALGAVTVPASPPPIARTLALAAAAAIRGDLVGVDLLPTASGFVVSEINGAVDFRPPYALDVEDVYVETVLAVAGDALRLRPFEGPASRERSAAEPPTSCEVPARRRLGSARAGAGLRPSPHAGAASANAPR